MGRANAIDRGTQLWVRKTGHSFDVREHPWLDGPVGKPAGTAHDWLSAEASRLGGELVESSGPAGLLSSMNLLESARFARDRLQPKIADFYERTTEWRIELWSQWQPLFWPAGWLLTTLFARRLQQLSLPLRPLELSQGVDSRIVQVIDRSTGTALGTAWLRTLRATGQTIYSGWYGTETLPGRTARSIRVVFPLPNGSLTVFLRPDIIGTGDLRLVSPLGQFGDDGAYLIVRDPGSSLAWVRRVPLNEQFDVYIDADGVLRTNHVLRLQNAEVLRLHYRLDRKDV